MKNLNKELAELSSMELNGTMPATPTEKSQAAQFLGRLGGKASVGSRFKGKTKEEVSEIMRKVRYSKKEIKEADEMAKEFVDALNLSQSSKP